MIAIPSIAFGAFSGSAKDVTARQVGGRSILSLRSWPTGQASTAQVVRRASISKITKSYRMLTDEQMSAWDNLASHTSGKSVLGVAAELSGINLYVRLNANLAMAGKGMIADAPASIEAVPDVVYARAWVTPALMVFSGIEHQDTPLKLVVKMSGGQSAGVSSGWSKTVIVSGGMEDDWGEADVTTLYLKALGIAPAVGQKVFIETWWLDTETGFAGQVRKDSVMVMSKADAVAAGLVIREKVTTDDIVASSSSMSGIDLDFSTGAPVVNHSAVLLGDGNVASSKVVLSETLDSSMSGYSYCVGRGSDEDGELIPQSYQMYSSTRKGVTSITYAFRCGDYIIPTEIFGPGIFYSS